MSMSKLLQKLLKVKKEMGTVIKGSKNDHFKSRYADLNAYLEVVDPVLEANGLLLLQPLVSSVDGDKVVTTILDVDTGDKVESEMKLLSVKNTMQDLGSAVTYARRYTLSSLLGLGAEDDDGELANGRGGAKQATKSWTPRQQTIETGVKLLSDKASAPVATEEKSTSSFRKKVTVKASAPVVTEESGSDGWE